MNEMMTEDLMSTDQAAALAGVKRRTMLRKIELEGLPRYANPLDKRSFLVRKKDVQDLIRPRPLQQTIGRHATA